MTSKRFSRSCSVLALSGLCFIGPGAIAAGPTQAPAVERPSSNDTKCQRSKKGGACFYEMGGSLVDGKRFGPSLIPINVDQRAVFGTLLTLRKPQFFKKSFDSAKLPLFR